MGWIWARGVSFRSRLSPPTPEPDLLMVEDHVRSRFFQAEGGIRDIGVTGVQTCALPIFSSAPRATHSLPARTLPRIPKLSWAMSSVTATASSSCRRRPERHSPRSGDRAIGSARSEERRVGKECRSRGSPYHYKKTDYTFK